MAGGIPRIYLNLVAATAVSIVVFGVLALFEYLMFGQGVLADRAPGVGLYFLGRSLLAFLLSLLIVGGLYGDRDRDSALAGMLPWKGTAGWTALASGAAFLAIFVADPALFSQLCREDRSIEWISALALFAASGLFLYAFVRLWKDPARRSGIAGRLSALAALILAVGSFVIGMEEISWMQRVLDIQTPAQLLQHNDQKELNFHNILTGTFETAYYLGAFAFLMLLPFVADLAPSVELPGRMSLLVPSRFVALASAPMAAFNYDMWDILPIQMSMMMSVLVLLFYAAAAFERGKRQEMQLFATAAFVLLVSQAAFLLLGDRLVRNWDPTEYKEMFIATGLACFALEVASRVREQKECVGDELSLGLHRLPAS